MSDTLNPYAEELRKAREAENWSRVIELEALASVWAHRWAARRTQPASIPVTATSAAPTGTRSAGRVPRRLAALTG
jgi:hypothetical protein